MSKSTEQLNHEPIPTPNLSIDTIKDLSTRFHGLTGEVGKVIVGQQEILNFILIMF